jgi:cell division protein FtsQ
MKKILSRLIEEDGVEIPDTPKRKRVVPIWRRTQTVVLGAVLTVSIVAGTVAWAVKSGWGKDVVTTAKWTAIKTSSELGLTIEDVLVSGRNETSSANLLAALGVVRGAPMLAYDFETAKARVESLPWVRNVHIERLLPDTLAVHLVERQPIALWQNQGKFSLIDEDGEVIANAELDPYANLIHVVGDDAPNRVGGLLELLETQPAVKSKVLAAVRIGGRRWDLLMKGGIDVRLPEDNAPEALARLAAFEAESGVLSRDVKVLDLRMPDRVIVRRVPNAVRKPQTVLGQET